MMNQLNCQIQTKIWKNVYEGCFSDMLEKRYEIGLTDEIGFIYSLYKCGIISYKNYCDQHRSFEPDFEGEDEECDLSNT